MLECSTEDIENLANVNDVVECSTEDIENLANEEDVVLPMEKKINENDPEIISKEVSQSIEDLKVTRSGRSVKKPVRFEC